MVNLFRYFAQALILCICTPVTLVLGFSFIPLWDTFGAFSLILPVLGVVVSYVAMSLFETVDELADEALLRLAE